MGRHGGERPMRDCAGARRNQIIIRPRTWFDDLQDRFPSLFRDFDPLMLGCEEGWSGLVTMLCELLSALDLPGLRVIQVKEKFGGLRFYVEGGNEAVSALIKEAEEESFLICERCGNHGELRGGGWLLTLCDACQDQRRIEQARFE